MKKKIAILLSLSMAVGPMSVPVYPAQEDPADLYAETAEVVSLEESEPEEEAFPDGDGGVKTESENGLSDETADTILSFGIGNAIWVFNQTQKPYYIVLVDPDDIAGSVSVNALKGVLLDSEESVKLENAMLPDGSEKPLEYSKGYQVYASEKEMVELIPANLMPYSEEDALVYTDPEDFIKIETPADAANLLDGEKIGFSAVVQKNNTVKFKWQNKADSKTYKSFELFRLKSDGKWESIMPASGKKGFTEGVDRFQASDKGYTEIYKLECKDESQNADSYVTVPAPMIYYVESGEVENTMDFAFTGFTRSPQIGYDLEVATDKNFTSPAVDHEESIDLEDTIEFNISKKVKAQAARADFYSEGTALSVGTQYYCRVRGTVTLGNLTIKGAPSLVKAVKQGPVKCELIDITGLAPDGTTTLGDDGWIPSVTEGYVVFRGPDPSKVKSYELLTCDTRYGIYKVFKKISVSEVKPYNPPQFAEYGYDSEGMYCAKLSFIPPAPVFYALRAISSTGNAKGGFSDGTMCWGQYKKVSDLQVVDSDVSSVTLSFKGESGANEYWIYRDTVSANLTKELTPAQCVGKVRNKFKKPGQSGTLSYKDKKGLVEGTVYYYTVRPVYTKAFSDIQKVDYEMIDGKFIPGYGETLADQVKAKPSLENAVVKNVKATVYSVKEVQITWGAVKGATRYNIYIVDGNVTGDDAKFEKILTVEKGSTEFSSRKARVVVPKVGHSYTFGVNVGGNSEDSKYATMTSSLATYPSNPTKLAANYSHYGNRGAKLTWTNPSEDKEYRSWIRYEIDYRDNEGSWNFLDYANATSSSYTDTYSLSRGIERQYRMRAVYADKDVTAYNSKVTGHVDYCKPYRITVANSSKDTIGSVTIDAGQTYSFRVYFYDRHGDTDVVTDKKLETVRISDSDIASVTTSGKDGDYAVVKVTGKKAGTTKLTVRARDYDDDDSRLSRTVTINVRNASK